MQPRIQRGERVIVDRSTSQRPGDTVVAIHDGEAVVKRLEKRNGDLCLTALRGQKPIKVTADTHIVGVVRTVMHRP